VKTKISWCNKRKASRWKQKYRGATKERHRGENNSVVPVQTFFTPILKAKSSSTKLHHGGGFEKKHLGEA
jgi:hypothetical protein